ncbi:unnamed protein product [Linum tenue]|uniref:WAT1-related protein n=2 Tax=Linum tenue TaxID=586396 RepID=A0AAV0L211_9ROSI|nr:unnamed protein product [Linum tenue]
MIYAGMILLSKAAFDGGLNTSIFVFYRQAFATVVIAPIAFFLEWKHAPPLSLPTFCKIFVLCFCGMTLNLNLNGVALKYTSATLAAASTNSIPVITFFLALLLGMETLKVRTRTGVAKLVEVVICLGGVATLAFYKGPHFKFLCFFKHLLKGQNQHPATSSSSHKSWAKGCFLMLSSNFTWSIWLVFQTIIMKSYPSKLMFTALQCLQSSIQSLVVAVAVERDLEEWKLGWNMRLLAVTYCGVVVNGVTYYLLAWVLEKKGPVFVVITTPLTFIFTMLCSALLCYSIPLGRYFFFYFGNIGDVPLLCTLVSNMHIYYFLHRKYHRPQ